MRKVFEKMKQTKELVSLYLKDDEKFVMGYILEIKDDEMLIFNINSHDRISEGSFLWIDIEEIYCLRTGGLEEERSLTKRKLFPEETLSKRLEGLELEIGDDETLQQAFLKYAKNNGKFVECKIADEFYVGKVEEVTDSFLALNEISYYGLEDGTSYNLLDSIQEIYIESKACRTAELLTEERA